MFTKVCSLDEIETSLPRTQEYPRRFVMDESNPTWVDIGKVSVARTFDGNLVVQMGDDTTVDKKAKFVDLYFDGQLCISTLFTREIEVALPSRSGIPVNLIEKQ